MNKNNSYNYKIGINELKKKPQSCFPMALEFISLLVTKMNHCMSEKQRILKKDFFISG